MAPNRQLYFLLSFPAMMMMVILGFVPLIFPLASKYEGDILPVVQNVHVEMIRKTEDGMYVDVTFDKVRSCEFLGISWYDTFGDRIPILFKSNGEAELPRTRPVRDGQNAGPWRLLGIDNLDGSVAIVSHRCHPLWVTFSKFWP